MFSFEFTKLVRKMRPTTRLSLEVLEDRTLPSVSSLPMSVASPSAAPQNAAMALFADSMVAQWDNLMATVRQDVLAASQAIGQQIAQEASAVGLQLDQILGISPSATNLSSPNAASHPSTRNATTTAGNATQPRHNSGTMEELATAQAPHSGGTSTVSSPDVSSASTEASYLWDPPDLSNIQASNPANWWVTGVRGAGTIPGNQRSDAVVFDPGNGLITDGHGNANINWDYKATFSSMQVGGKNDYISTQNIQSGIIVNLTGAALGTALIMVNAEGFGPHSSLNLNFPGSGSEFNISGTGTMTNFNFTLTPGGLADFVQVTSGGSVYAGGGTAYTETTQVPILVEGGTLTLEPVTGEGQTPVILKNGASMSVDNGGTLMLDDNQFGQGITYIQGDGPNNIGQNGEVLFVEPQGTVNCHVGTWGIGLGMHDSLNVPVRNRGLFNLVGSTPGTTFGGVSTLQILGSDPQTSNVSYYMQGFTAAAATNLSGGVELWAQQGYYQVNSGSSAYLYDSDSNANAVGVGGLPAMITIGPGTSVSFDHYSSTFGLLGLAGNVSMYGTLQVNIDGTQSNACDLITIFSPNIMTWYEGSIVTVHIYNYQLNTGLQWVIMKAKTLNGMNNVTVTPNTLTLDGAAWAQGIGQLDS